MCRCERCYGAPGWDLYEFWFFPVALIFIVAIIYMLGGVWMKLMPVVDEDGYYVQKICYAHLVSSNYYHCDSDNSCAIEKFVFLPIEIRSKDQTKIKLDIQRQVEEFWSSTRYDRQSTIEEQVSIDNPDVRVKVFSGITRYFTCYNYI